MSKLAALNLASWIRQRYRYSDPLSHLKLQKLTFYGYGFAAARGFSNEIGPIAFEPWQHGPVCRAVWDQYKSHGGGPIPRGLDDLESSSYAPGVERVLLSVLGVYGLMDAWAIRQESHTEEPWRSAFDGRAALIDDAKIVEHFKTKYVRSERFRLPEYLFDRGSFSLDGTPIVDFESLEDAARALETVFPLVS